MRIYLWESSVIPNISVVRKTVPHVTQFPTFYILLDWIERFFLRYLHFSIGPPRDLYNHVQDAILSICKERDIMPCRYNRPIMFDEYAVFWIVVFSPRGSL